MTDSGTETSGTQNPGTQRVAIIGAGTMGGAMAARLLDRGFEVAVWSRHRDSTAGLRKLGASDYDRAADAVAGAQVVVTMLATAEATESVMFEEGTLDAMRPGAVWAQMATVGVTATERLSDESGAVRPDVVFVDAPVSGSRQPAESGQLLILASGAGTARERLEPVFGALGRATMWLEPAGMGSRLKLVLNTWLAFQIEGAAESAGLAERLGVDPACVLQALHGNPLASPYAEAKLTKMLHRDFSAEFALDWALKDLDLVASDAGIDAAPVARAVAERWRHLVQDGASGLDVSAARLGLGDTRTTHETTGTGART